MAQVSRLDPKVGGRLALFCIHRTKWVNYYYCLYIIYRQCLPSPKLSQCYGLCVQLLDTAAGLGCE